MPKIFHSSLPTFAALVLLGLSAATSDAAWPRYRVSAGYSLPSAPSYRPAYPVAPAYLPPAPVPNYGVPSYAAPVPAANIAPSYYGQPAPNTSYYAPPSYSPQSRVPPPATSYYAPQQPQAIQPYVPPQPIQSYGQPMQPAGGFYQPTRPSSFYSPTPGYFYPQPVFGRY